MIWIVVQHPGSTVSKAMLFLAPLFMFKLPSSIAHRVVLDGDPVPLSFTILALRPGVYLSRPYCITSTARILDSRSRLRLFRILPTHEGSAQHQGPPTIRSSQCFRSSILGGPAPAARITAGTLSTMTIFFSLSRGRRAPNGG